MMDYDPAIDLLDNLITEKEDEIEKLREAKTLLEQLRDGVDGGGQPAPKKKGPSAPARRALIAERASKSSNGTPPAKTTPGKRRQFGDDLKKKILSEYRKAAEAGKGGEVLEKYGISYGHVSRWEAAA